MRRIVADRSAVSAVTEHIFSLPFGMRRLCWPAAADVADPPPVWVIGRGPATVAIIDCDVVVVKFLAINGISHGDTMLYA